MREKRYLAISFSLIILGLLLNINIFSVSAGDLKVTNAIGVHTFNLSDAGDYIISEGSSIIENTLDEDVIIIMTVDNALRERDLGENGEPRTHEPTGDRLVYHIPSMDWIKPNEKETVLKANSIGTVNYTIKVPIEEVYSALNGNIDKAYLCYINIKGDSTLTIGVNYNHKVFIVFEGEFQDLTKQSFPLSIVIGGIIFTIILIYFILSFMLEKKRKKSKIPIFEITEENKLKKELPKFKSTKLISNLELSHTLSELEGKNEQK